LAHYKLKSKAKKCSQHLVTKYFLNTSDRLQPHEFTVCACSMDHGGQVTGQHGRIKMEDLLEVEKPFSQNCSSEQVKYLIKFIQETKDLSEIRAYEVESIKDDKVKNGQILFLVSWKHFPEVACSSDVSRRTTPGNLRGISHSVVN